MPAPPVPNKHRHLVLAALGSPLTPGKLFAHPLLAALTLDERARATALLLLEGELAVVGGRIRRARSSLHALLFAVHLLLLHNAGDGERVNDAD